MWIQQTVAAAHSHLRRLNSKFELGASLRALFAGGEARGVGGGVVRAPPRPRRAAAAARVVGGPCGAREREGAVGWSDTLSSRWRLGGGLHGPARGGAVPPLERALSFPVARAPPTCG